MDYYLYLNSEQVGPYTKEQIVLMVASGQVLATDFAWREGMEQWLPIEKVMTLTAPTLPVHSSEVSACPTPKSFFPAFAGPAFKGYSVSIALTVFLTIAAYLISPFWSVRKLRQAAESKNLVYITDNVDFPSLRESLKSAINAQMIKKAASSQGKDESEGLGAALGAMMVGPLVDALVTPEAVIGLMQGSDLDALSSQTVGGDTASSAAADNEKPAESSINARYEGLNRFIMTSTDKNKSAASLVFQREGLLSWKLSGVRLQGE